MDIITVQPDEEGSVDWPTPSLNRKSVVTVGVFDGMHRGHRAVISRVVELAQKTDSFSTVILFDPRPGLVHHYAATHNGAQLPDDGVDADALTSVNQRLRVMDDLGVDRVLVVRYSLAFAAKSYRFFLGQLVGKLGMRTLVLGADAAMGNGREGDVAAIRTLSQATGVFELDVVDDRGPGYVYIPADATPQAPSEPGEPKDPTDGMSKAQRRAWTKRHQGRKTRVWSSTNVRYLLGQGRIQAANEILGSNHGVEGTVVHGEERGRTLGFPTANLGEKIDGYLPVDGVYAGWLIDLDDSEHESEHRWPAAISIGTKPTFSEQTGLHERVAEANAITDGDTWLDLYGHRVRFEFAGFLNPMVCYNSSEELVAALNNYVEQTRQLTSAVSDA